jgi:hypothetical protein
MHAAGSSSNHADEQLMKCGMWMLALAPAVTPPQVGAVAEG